MTLELRDTALLVDAMRPPAGMELSAAVGTTFTLDLASLLAIPVAASFAAVDEDGEDPASLLETIRRYSDTTVLFCQAGAISVPTRYRAALTFVERCVVEVQKPASGIFHPKVWAVRFAGSGRVHHRVLVTSRNLTFDRAQDVIVRLDEDSDATVPVKVSPLLSLLRDLTTPEYAARPLDSRQRDMVEGLLKTLRAARFAVPEPFDSGRLVVGRPRSRRRPFHERCDHVLAVSPFLTSAAVSDLVATADTWSGIVSRRESLDQVTPALREATEVFRVCDLLLTAQESADVVIDDSTTAADASDDAVMRGLHAKLYVQDVGDRSTMWLGSANLTAAGFGGNVEVLAELNGPTSKVGVDAVLDPKRERRDLGALIEEHPLPEIQELPDEDIAEEGLGELEVLAFELASRNICLAISHDGDLWQAELLVTPWPDLDDIGVSARPLSVKEADFVTVADGVAQWRGLDLTALTPFVVLQLRGPSRRRQILVRADLQGDPPQRRGAVLARAIKSPEDFLRYLAAMLGLAGGGLVGSGDGDKGKDSGTWIRWIRADRILEDLLTTASRSPKRLESLHETLQQLDTHPETRTYVPDDFRAVWAAVRVVLPRRIR